MSDINKEQDIAKKALRQKNFTKRLGSMQAGLFELENWLLDTLRQGIAELEQRPYSFWKEISVRMVDAKLGGIAKRIRNLPILIGSSKDWPEKILEELSSYYLLIRGLRKMEALPIEMQQDLLSFAGVTTRKEDLFQNGQFIFDTWMVMGQVEGVEENLNFRRTWLLGNQTRRFGMILDYAFGNQPFKEMYNKGDVFEANIVFYPSNSPLRVAIQQKKNLNKTIKKIIGFKTFSDYLDFYAITLLKNPLQLFFPCALESVRPVLDQEDFFLIDAQNKIIPVSTISTVKWKMLAISGGNPINIFGEWTGRVFLPLSLTVEQQYIELSDYNGKLGA